MSLPYFEAIIDATIDLASGGVVAAKHSDRHVWKQSTTAYVVRDTSGAGGKPSDAALTTYKIPVTSEKWSTDLQHVIISGAMPALSDEGHTLTLLDSANNEVFVWPDYNQAATDGSGSGTGAFLATLTINDGAAAIQGAAVRMTVGINSYTATTDSSGHASFGLDAATYTVSITKGGYSFTPVTLAVSANTTHTYSMTASAITPASDPTKTNAFGYVYGNDTNILAGATIYFHELATPGSAVDGQIFDGDDFSVVSDVTGLIEAELWQSTSYAYRFGKDGKWKPFTTGTAGTYPLPKIMGGTTA